MKRKITFLSAAFMLLAFLAIPLGMRGQAPVNTVLWGETWTGGSANQTPSDYGFSGTTIYGGTTITYAQSSTNTKLYAETLAGGTSPELLLSKSNQTWTISNIPTGQATEMSLTFLSNKTAFAVTSTTDDINISGSGKEWTITAASTVSNFDLTIQNTSSSNARIDDIELIVTTAGGDTPIVTHTLTAVAYPTEGGNVTVGNNTLAEGATTSISATANTGFVFGSWTVTGNGSSVNDEGNAFTMGTEDATLTANFTAVTTYTVTYHANVTGIEDVVDTYNEGATVTLRPANTFTNEGYTFSEWNTQADGDGDAYDADDVINGIDEDLVLYAIWTENTTPGGEDLELTFGMTSNPGGWPTANSTTLTEYTYTLGGVDYTFALKNVKCNSGYLMMTQVAVLGLPAIDGYKLTKVVASNSSGCSTSTKVGISSSATSEEYIDGGDIQTWSTTSSTYTYNLTSTASNTMYYMYVTNKNAQVINLALTYEAVGGTPAPSITAENVSIAYDATSGSIVYEINNGVDGGTLTAATESDWLTLPETFASPIQFTCTANEAAADRTATVTLTYTYDSQTVTKNVTVTQAGDPNVTPTIAQVREQGTGEVVTRGIVTSCSGITAYIQDATAAICVYGEELTVGDEIRVSGTLTTYKGLLEIANNPQVTVLSSGNVIEPQLMTVGEVVASENQGWYIRIEEATVTNINNKNVTISQGDNSILVYFNSTDDITFVENNVISLNGNIGCYNTTQIANPQNVEVQAAPAEPSITLDEYTINVEATSGDGMITVEYTNIDELNPHVQLYDAEGAEVEPEYYDWISVNINGEIDDNVHFGYDANTATETRTVYFKVYNGEVYSNMATITQAAYVAPVEPASITVEPAEVSVDAAEHDGTIIVTYNNITEIAAEVYFCDAEGESAEYDWIAAEIDDDNNVNYVIEANEGDARTAYLKVYALDNNAEGVYSDIVTINQAAPVEPVAAGNFELFTGELEEGDYVVYYDGYAMKNTVENGRLSYETVTPENDVITTDNAAIIWHIAPAGDYWTIYSADANAYAASTGVKNKAQMLEDGTDDMAMWSVTGTEEYEFVNKANAAANVNAYLRNNGTYGFACYAASTGGDLSLYKRAAEPQPSITMEFDYIEVTATGESDYVGINYEILEIAQASDFGIQFYNANGGELNGEDEPDWMTAVVTTQPEEDGYFVYYVIDDNDGEARTAYFKVFAMNGEDFVYSNLVTINQEEYVAPVVPESWVLTDFADLMEGDVFVIVGDNGDTYVMPNNNGTSAPSAVEITVDNDALTQEPAANLQWNLSITDNGYIFYPNGDTENWLYCINNNNGLKVGNGDNNTFIIKDDYLYNTGRERYIGIYNSQDWRSYTSINSNIAGQTFSFYKKVVEPETYTLDITGYGDNEGGYYLIASPVYVNPETTGMTQGDFDLYWFDQNQVTEEWRNYEASHFNLVPGKGYLYAHKTDTILTFAGTPYSGDGTIKLVKNEDAVFSGWNLVGNPFSQTAYIDRDYYTMKEDGSEIVAADEEDGSVEPMHGIFVIADEDNDVITFDTVSGMSSNVEEKVVINVTNNRGIVDRAIVRFGEGRQLPKFQLKEYSTKVYIPQGTGEYAVVRSVNQGDMPVNFKASEEGTYTFSVNTGDLEVEYLHLIDNMTGADVDLLRTPSYTFDANTTDFASRFRLVFSANGVDDNTESSNASFAFYNGSEWVISNTGAATLQVVDVMGRVLSTESINGNATANVNQVAGIYMLRLVNGDNVRVQKIVVK